MKTYFKSMWGGGGSEYLLNTSVVDILTIGITNYSVFTTWQEER